MFCDETYLPRRRRPAVSGIRYEPGERHAVADAQVLSEVAQPPGVVVRAEKCRADDPGLQSGDTGRDGPKE